MRDLLIPPRKGGIKRARGGGRVEHHCEGGEVKSDLLSRESKQRVTWNLSPFVFFDSEKTGGNLTCGPPSSGDGGGDNDNNDNGGGDNDNDGIDDNDNGGDDKDDDVSDDDHNGGNGGDGGGGCNTATAVGIDRQVNNQLKAAIDTGHGRPRGGGRSHGQRRHGSSL